MTDDPTSLLAQFYDFARSGRGTAAVGVALMILVWGLRNGLGAKWSWFKTPIGGYVLGFGLPTIVYLGSGLMAEQPVTFSMFLNAAGAGWIAAGGWEHLRDLMTSLKKPPTPTVVAAATVALLLLSACAGSTREKTIHATYDTTNVAADHLMSYSHDHEANILKTATTTTVAEKELADFRAKVDHADKSLKLVYQAIATALILNDEVSLTALLKVADVWITELKDLGVPL